jgi:hypothetical protein
VVSTSPEVQNTTEPLPPGSKPASGKNTISRSNDDSGYSHTVMEDKVILPEQPLQLIHPDPNHHRNLEIISSNVKHLHHIHTAVAVVAVVGKFHSGKSFLLNQLMGKQEGFGVGPSVRPQTMGIWMWGKVRGILYKVVLLSSDQLKTVPCIYMYILYMK